MLGVELERQDGLTSPTQNSAVAGPSLLHLGSVWLGPQGVVGKLPTYLQKWEKSRL